MSRQELRSFATAAAFTCSESDKTLRDGDEWIVEARKATDTDMSSLVAAFDQPSMKPAHGPCAAIGTVWPPLIFVDRAGNYIVPPEPADGCGMPLDSVTQAVGAVRWQTISARKKHLVASADALAAGCEMQVKNMPYLDTRDSTREPRASVGGPVFTRHPDAPLSVCEYHAPESEMDGGTFVRGSHLDASDSAELRDALTGAGPADELDCTSQPDFSVITVENGGSIFLELGDCWRLQRDDNGHVKFGTASSPQTVRRILGTT